jgi:beta-lactamase regulating signal transducer with metallopeptidase domain
MTDLLLELAWKSVVTSGGALFLLGLLRHRSAAERSLVASAGVMATLLLAPLVVFGPRVFIAGAAVLPDALVPQTDDAVSAGSGTAAALALDASAPLADQVPPLLTPETVATVLYMVPATVLMILLATGILRLFVLRARAEILMDSGWHRALAHAQRRMCFKHGTALLVSDEIDSPVSWGLLRPTILLNSKAVSSASTAEAIIAHELAHVTRFDWLRLMLGRAAVALFWFNPLVWILFRQSHQLSEEAADDAVLAADIDSTEYANLLIEVATHENRAMLIAANGVALSPSSMKQRIVRILDPNLNRRPARGLWTATCLLVSSVGIMPVAALTIVKPPAPSPPVDVAPSSHPALPGGRLNLPRFDAVQLRGGAYITVRHGARQHVRLISGFLDPRQVSVDERKRLIIDCGNSCTGARRALVEIVSPDLRALAVDGGGTIRSQGTFPLFRSLDLALKGGGTLDARAMEARTVAAALDGGGTIMTSVREKLSASANGGGAIRYWGRAKVDRDVQRGGRVELGGT